MPSQQVLEEKSSEVEAIKDILKGYKSIGIASLKKVRASQLQELKKDGLITEDEFQNKKKQLLEKL